MDSLPNEIILLILEYCDVRSALKLIRTCKRIRGLKPLLKNRMLSEPVHYLGITNKDVLFSFNGQPSIIEHKEFTTIYDGIVVKGDKMVLRGKVEHFRNETLLYAVLVHSNGDGEITHYTENGDLETKCHCFQTELGYNRVYYCENGSIRELIPEFDGEWHGNVVWCYRNGSVMDVRPHVNGQLHGTRKQYYETGELMDISYFEFGLCQGEHFHYDRDGNIIFKALYEGGLRVRVLESNGVVYAAT